MYEKLYDQAERGQNLKHLISMSRHKTQDEFAYAVGVDVRTVRRWVSEGFDSIYTAQNCADALGLSVETILFKG